MIVPFIAFIGAIKNKLGEKLAQNIAEKMERGDFGALIQSAYVATKGYKTLIGTLLTTISLAVAEFSPPWAEAYARNLTLVVAGLTGLGLLDKLRRNEPVFPLWFLDALARITAALSMISALFTFMVVEGYAGHFMGDAQRDELTFYGLAVMSAVGFLNRLAKASAAQPKDPQPKEEPNATSNQK